MKWRSTTPRTIREVPEEKLNSPGSYYISYYTAIFGSFDVDCNLLKDLEAAIGIDPMNKGFAVLANLFAQVRPCFLVSIFITVFDISSLPVIAQIRVYLDW
jgi:hypothetical protein